MNLETGIQVRQGPVLDSEHIVALQHLGEACWRNRKAIGSWIDRRIAFNAFAFISGNVLQVDVDQCAVASTRTRYSNKVFLALLGSNAVSILQVCQKAYDTFYLNVLEPAARNLYGIQAGVRLQAGRKLLLSGRCCEPQLLHLDSLWPTLVGNVYIRPRSAEEVPMLATVFPREGADDSSPISPVHPRDLQNVNLDGILGRDSLPWDLRADIGPRTVHHNSAVIFCGNVVHGGPGPDRLPEQTSSTTMDPRMVMFQMASPLSSPDENLSNFQEFEFSLHKRLYGNHQSTQQALARTSGRWKDHMQTNDQEFFELLAIESSGEDQYKEELVYT